MLITSSMLISFIIIQVSVNLIVLSTYHLPFLKHVISLSQIAKVETWTSKSTSLCFACLWAPSEDNATLIQRSVNSIDSTHMTTPSVITLKKHIVHTKQNRNIDQPPIKKTLVLDQPNLKQSSISTSSLSCTFLT